MVRIATPAFHPNAAQRVVPGNPRLFALLRTAADGDRLLAVTNVTAERQRFRCPPEILAPPAAEWVDRLSDRRVPCADEGIDVLLEPYEVLWLAPAS